MAAFQEDRQVFRIELDKQGTLSDWVESRKLEEGPDFERIDSTMLEKAIETLHENDYELVVIDTPGADNPHINAVMRVSGLCLIPCRPTATDLRGCLPTVQA